MGMDAIMLNRLLYKVQPHTVQVLGEVTPVSFKCVMFFKAWVSLFSGHAVKQAQYLLLLPPALNWPPKYWLCLHLSSAFCLCRWLWSFLMNSYNKLRIVRVFFLHCPQKHFQYNPIHFIFGFSHLFFCSSRVGFWPLPFSLSAIISSIPLLPTAFVWNPLVFPVFVHCLLAAPFHAKFTDLCLSDSLARLPLVPFTLLHSQSTVEVKRKGEKSCRLSLH